MIGRADLCLNPTKSAWFGLRKTVALGAGDGKCDGETLIPA
jgi:hypothetical protein